MNLIFLIIAFAGGAAISIQAAVNSQLAGGLGGNTLAASLVSFFIGTLTLAILALCRGGLPAALAELPAQPLWRLAGGMLGAAAIFSTILVVPRIGLVNMLALFIAGQLLLSLVIDQFGLLGAVTRPVSPLKLAGAAIMLMGLILTLFGDRIFASAARTVSGH